jgi:hypothetical protein
MGSGIWTSRVDDLADALKRTIGEFNTGVTDYANLLEFARRVWAGDIQEHSQFLAAYRDAFEFARSTIPTYPASSVKGCWRTSFRVLW